MEVEPDRYDAIVIGLGGHGSAALYHLARRGAKVLGLEQFGVAHDRGSSHGESRIIRLAYHEAPEYVPLLQRAWQLWRDLEAETGQSLLCDTGCLEAADPGFNGGDNCFTHSLASARQHGLEHEVLTGEQCNARFPGYALPPSFKAVLAPGGILASERCIRAHLQAAQQHGAAVRTGEAFQQWRALPGGGVSVTTDRGTYAASKLVLAAGAWMPDLVPELKAVLRVERQVIGWFQISDPACFRKEAFPVNVVEDSLGYFYSFPQYERPGFKIGRFNHRREAVPRPERLPREVTAADEQVLREAVAAWFPAANGPLLSAAACMFTNTPDTRFILDTHPAHEQVLLCSACSGHGFKFCSVIGEILADLALQGSTSHDISLHRIDASRQGHAQLLASFQGQQARL